MGDDLEGPHSSAIIIGRKTVVGCANSLGFLEGIVPLVYNEDYWIQSSFTINKLGEYTDNNRIPVKLYKFNVGNDWALFYRSDGKLFLDNEIASIDRALVDDPSLMINHLPAVVCHFPVSLKHNILRANEFSISCFKSSVHIQNHSAHHVKYEGRYLYRGSSGGGVYIGNSTLVFGMHIEAINEVDYDAQDDAAEQNLAKNSKRVDSEDTSYGPLIKNPSKRHKVDSETVASIAGGNNGSGSALIFCKFPRLMHYIMENEIK